MVENFDQCYLFENQALERIRLKNLALESMFSQKGKGLLDVNHSNGYKAYNQMIAGLMSDLSSGVRFPCENGYNMKKIGTSLVPFPRLHFFIQSSVSSPAVETCA